MKSNVVIVGVLVLLLAGAGGAWLYLQLARPGPEPAEGDAARHGRAVEIGANPNLCASHGIPEAACPFCDPGLVEALGQCGEHDVPEALCTRCSPMLIAAFKAEGDWCADHGLPASQCLVCLGEEDG